MKIDNYKFGVVSINGKKYFKDLIIKENKIFSPWVREEGHFLKLNDIKEYLDGAENLIIGNGYSGLMKVSDDLLNYTKEKNIKLLILKTKEACEKFNKIKDKEKLVCAFHLTC